MIFRRFFAFSLSMSILQKHAPDPLKLCREAHTDKHGDQHKREKCRNIGHEIAANRAWEHKNQKNAPTGDFGRVLGSIWGGFGPVWGLSWAFLGGSWQFWGRPKASFFTS